MSKSLLLADGLWFPIEAATETLLIVGKRGSGKSSTATRFAEQLIRANIHIAVLDPADVWWGLKAGRDGGRDGGLEVYVFGGHHADLPLEPTGGVLMADVLVESRINAVMVIRQFSNKEKARFVGDFAERIYQRNQDVLHIIAEEAHEIMPQSPYAGEEEMLGRMLRLWKGGRTAGLGLTAVTQRPASLNKNATTQAEVLVAHRVLGPQDIKAIEQWIKHHNVEDLKEQVLSTLPELKTGDAWVWAPDFPEAKPIGLRRVHFSVPETFDSRRTPKPGEGRAEPEQLAPVDLEKLRSKMAATIERAKQQDPRELQREVVRLKAELARKPHAVTAAPAVKEIRVEIPILKDGQVTRLEKAIGTWDQAAARLVAVGQAMSQEAKVLTTALVAARNGAKPPVPARRAAPLPVASVPRFAPTARHVSAPTGDLKLGKAERLILSVLAQYPQGRTVTQVALLTGYAVAGGAFRNPLGKLRSAGYVEGGRGDVLRITTAGTRAIEGQWEPLPAPGPDLLAHWQRRLGHAEREILRVLVAVYPRSLTAAEIAARTQSSKGDPYEVEGGAFRNPLGRLRTFELIEGRGELRASSTLCIEEA